MAAMPGAAAPQPGGRLNLIHIGVDTWGTNWLGCYGAQQIRTPAVDKLARRSAVFADMYPEVLPTIPCRRSIYTGRRIFPADLIQQPDDQVKIRGWHQMYAEDVTISETLKASGYTTAIVSDLYHQFKPDKNFHRGFDSWEWIRGQESDRLASGPKRSINVQDYLHRTQPAGARGGVMQYLLNRRKWKTEDDWLAARVFRRAGEWLEDNVEENQPFYLHIESFSPHEFWDPPERFYREYMKSDYRGPRLISPPQVTKDMSPVEVEHVRALYAGLAAFVDHCISGFLEKAEAMGLMKNTVIVFVADHGTMMGERGQLHKGENRIRTQVTHVPLAIYHPQKQWDGRRVRGFVQHTDIMPTVLDLLGVKIPSRVTGENLATLLEKREDSRRDTIVTGWGEHAAIRNPEWLYITRWSPGPPFEELYDVRKDPEELKNVAESHPAVVKQLRDELKRSIDGGWEVTRGTFSRKLA